MSIASKIRRLKNSHSEKTTLSSEYVHHQKTMSTYEKGHESIGTSRRFDQNNLVENLTQSKVQSLNDVQDGTDIASQFDGQYGGH